MTSPVLCPEVWPQVFRMIRVHQSICCNQNSAWELEVFRRFSKARGQLLSSSSRARVPIRIARFHLEIYVAKMSLHTFTSVELVFPKTPVKRKKAAFSGGNRTTSPMSALQPL